MAESAAVDSEPGASKDQAQPLLSLTHTHSLPINRGHFCARRKEE